MHPHTKLKLVRRRNHRLSFPPSNLTGRWRGEKHQSCLMEEPADLAEIAVPREHDNLAFALASAAKWMVGANSSTIDYSRAIGKGIRMFVTTENNLLRS